MNENVFFSLGSNEQNACTHLERARHALEDIPYLRFSRASSVYCTEPQGYAAQPWFHNCVLQFRCICDCSPSELLMEILSIETQLGRIRPKDGPRFGPRVIDIDLLLFGERTCTDPGCTVPHPRMYERAFVLVPLLEITPDLSVSGKRISSYLERLDYHVEGNRIYQPVQ